MERPDYVSINGQHIKVHRWQVGADGIAVTAMVNGDFSGNALLESLSIDQSQVSWEGFEPVEADIAVTAHRVNGEGPRAVHRLEFTMHSDAFPRPAVSLPDAERIDVLEKEVRELRREIAALRARVEELGD
ncbi:MAG: bZIP transcription factor [Thermomicrobiales bacterium]|nr:bZIP transcription factor [Thermomicrobiales bacterium]